MGEQPSTKASFRRSVSKDELLDLYQAIKSADAISLFDAAEALGQDDVATACEKLLEAKTRYERKHARALARNPNASASAREQKKAATRRKKVQDALQKFSEYYAALEKMVKIQRAVPPPKADLAEIHKLQAASSSPSRSRSQISILPDLLRQFRSMMMDDSALEFITSEYEVATVETVSDVSLNSVFVVRGKATWYLLRCTDKPKEEHPKLLDLVTEKTVSVPTTTLLAAAKRGHAFKLQRLKSQHEDIVLDESELNVLWAVVRDTKLLPNASEITLIMKNEFRRRKYDRALKKMLMMQRSFNAAARAKRNEFKRELAMLDQQKLSMSLREVERRKLRIAQETRLMERAESHFTKVMNCLHALDSRRS